MDAERPPSGRDKRRRAYAQNLLASRALAAQLVNDAKIRPDELVVEIGAGTGILTAELERRATAVLAIELDPVYAAQLRKQFGASRRVEVIEGDARRIPLPTKPFRVVANLPFNATTALMHRLLDNPTTPLTRADLLVQWEVARKRAGRPRSALSAEWSPWWRFRLGRRIPRSAFRPQPAVDAAVLIIERRPTPLLPLAAQPRFAEFVQGVFIGTLARELQAVEWARLFAAYLDEPPRR